MQQSAINRRSFLASTSALLGGVGAFSGPWITSRVLGDEKPRAKVERLGIGSIGLRYQGSVITEKARLYGDIVALADVDRNVREQARASFGSTPQIFEDYRELLSRKDVDVVLIGAPDHWHTKMLLDAMRAGKDVYCEKPLTLTIDEGKLLRKTAAETGRIVQVGSWQRSDFRFRKAVEMVRQGRVGDLQRVEVVLGKNVVGGPFETASIPRHFNWNLWQGQTPDVPFIPERSHYTFRWWHEYSGGQMTDWGAHHIDIAQWAINSLPVEINGVARFAAETSANSYNVPIDFEASYKYANGVEMTVADHGRNGILFTGTKGRIFVSRESLTGKPVEDLTQDPLGRDRQNVYDFDNTARPERAGKLDAIINHMGNFFDCVQARRKPISDIESQHRAVSTCHLGNIAMRLGRPLKWNPETEQFIDAPDADKYLSREQRHGFEVV